MKKTHIFPSFYPKSRGIYSPAIAIDLGNAELIFVSGIIAKNEDGTPISEKIEEQAEFVFKQIEMILAEAGATMDDIVKAQIFLTDINNFKKVSAIRDKYFANSKPVSTMLEISNTVRPGCNIEIEVTAIKQK